MCFPVASPAGPDESPQRREGDAVSLLFHEGRKACLCPLPKPVGRHGSAATEHRRSEISTAAGAPPTRCWHSAGATVGTGASSGRHGRAEESRGRRSKGGQAPAHSERARSDLLPQQRPVGVEEQRPLLRKQPLEEGDNGPMTLELRRCARWAAGRSSRASLLLMRPRRTTPGSPRKGETEHSPGPERASTTQCRTPASDAVHKVLARCRGSTGATTGAR